MIKHQNHFFPQNKIRFFPVFSNNINLLNQRNVNNNIPNQNRIRDFLSRLEEHCYLDIPITLKLETLNKCFLCNKPFLNHERVKIFSCRKHIFHTNCLKDWIELHINSPYCPKCQNLNISANPFRPRNNLRNIPLNFRLGLHRDDFNNDFDDEHNDDFDDLNDEDNYPDDLDLDNEDIDDDWDDLPRFGLNKEILDNMEISKIKDVGKLDNDKKKCTICLEDYVNGDDSIALPCIHIFHANCIKTWLKNQNTCPICKYEIKYEIENIENDEMSL